MRVSELARWLDLTPRRVQQLVTDEILPRPIGRDYDGQRCVTEYVRYLRRQIQGEGNPSLTDERTRLARLQADRHELELETTHGNLVATDWVVEAFGRVFEVFRARALALPAKLAPDAHGAKSIAEAKEAIETGVHELLEGLSYPDSPLLSRYVGRAKRKGKAARSHRGRGGNGSAATSTNSQSME